MKTTGITTVAEYLESLPEDRRKTITKVRALVKKHIPEGYKDLAVESIAEVIAAVPMADYIAATLKVHGKKQK